jgi:hypothetical protein
MKLTSVNNFVVTILLVLFVTAPFNIMKGQEQKKSFTVNKGDLLDLSTRMGNITIDTWDKSEVNVVVRNILSSETDLLRMEQKGGKVEVEFKGKESHNIEFDVTIPSELNLDLSTGGGNIDLKNDLKGTIDASTGGGNISTKNISGKTDLTTAGGNVSVGNINSTADISTAGGDLRIGDVNGEADLSTAGGNVKVGTVGGNADISTAGGNISVEAIDGNADVNTAGGNIRVKMVTGTADVNTAGGNISLSGATGKVKTNTAGGNLSLKDITGYIDANTAAGNIYAELKPDGTNPSNLNTAAGNIKLMVPSSAKATIVATFTVLVWGDSKDEMENIESDFPSTKIERMKDRRQIRVTYVLNGGGSRIELNTAMGKIEIRNSGK